jgi:DNA-binding response OmpR family regulator
MSTDDSIVRFGVFEGDPPSGELRKGGIKIKLQDLPFQVLKVLVERPGELVTRDELRTKLSLIDFLRVSFGRLPCVPIAIARPK